MNEYKFTGQNRKALVGAISDILGTEKKYLGTPSYGYQVGEITIDRYATATGEFPFGLLTALAERGFVPEMETETTAEPETETPEQPTEPETPADSFCISLPLNGFAPESLENLTRMVTAKEPLIKKALGVDAIPIKVLEDSIEFPWFTADHSDSLMAYGQFITALCATAKEKKRITAKPQETFENEKFTMRVWLIGLGLIGKEYGQIRKLMGANLSGNSGWRYGTPEKAVTETAPAPETAGETPAETLPDDAGMNSLPELLADAALIHAVNASFD